MNAIARNISDYFKPRLSPSVVIVGANFAGLQAAMSLQSGFAVTVIDPWPWFEFLPNIHELVSGAKTPEMLRYSKEALLKRLGHTYLPEAASRILPAKNTVVTRSGQTISYDYALIAVGAENNTYGIKGADIHALPFDSVDRCHIIGNRLKDLAGREKPFSVVIAGGGLEGVEALGEILRAYRDYPGLCIHMVEGRERLMPGIEAGLDSEIRRLCAPYPVEFHTRVTVRRVSKHQVDLSDGTRIDSDATIWTGGKKPPALLYASGLSPAPDRWAPVNDMLQAAGHENLFIAGDDAQMTAAARKQAYHAMDMGRNAGENIGRLHGGKPLKPYAPSAKPLIVAFGDLGTFVIAGKTVFSGTALGTLKEAVFQITMPRFDPAGRIGKTWHASARAASATARLARPALRSPASLLKMPDVHLLG